MDDQHGTATTGLCKLDATHGTVLFLFEAKLAELWNILWTKDIGGGVGVA